MNVSRRCCAAVGSLYSGSYRGFGVDWGGGGVLGFCGDVGEVGAVGLVGRAASHSFSVRIAALAVMGLYDLDSMMRRSRRLDGTVLCSFAWSISVSKSLSWSADRDVWLVHT